MSGDVPYLPAGIERNAVFNTVPELFEGLVDGAQNHWDKPDFYRRVAEAGLVLEDITLEEIPTTAGRRTSVAVTGYAFAPETQSVSVVTEDGRIVQLDTRCYRGEFSGAYSGQRRTRASYR